MLRFSTWFCNGELSQSHRMHVYPMRPGRQISDAFSRSIFAGRRPARRSDSQQTRIRSLVLGNWCQLEDISR